MPITTDISQLLASIAALPAKIARGIDGGLSDAAKVAEEIMQTSPAHGDQSGAAHASSFAAALGPDAQARADQAYDTASSLLTGFTGHAGRAVAITVEGGAHGLVLGRPISYAQTLEDNGKAVVGPAFQEIQELALRLASEGAAAELGR